jgi:hypothetical protein
MKKCISTPILMLFIFSFSAFLPGCSKKNEVPKPSDVWDIDKKGIPKFVGVNYIEIEKIYRISKFRSSVGHDYSDSYESCRSMKHYFEPRNNVDWSTVKIFSPVSGIITRAEMEWAGTKLEIVSEEYPAFRFSVFHINTTKSYFVGDTVVAGEQLGTHIGSQTMSDMSVIVNDPTRQGRMVSYFEVITDDVFNEYSSHGIGSRDDLVITKIIRDANPLSCSGDTFTSTDTLENWVYLN